MHRQFGVVFTDLETLGQGALNALHYGRLGICRQNNILGQIHETIGAAAFRAAVGRPLAVGESDFCDLSRWNPGNCWQST